MTALDPRSPLGQRERVPSRLHAVAPLLSALVILVFVAATYRALLLARPGTAFPFGCDTWGHLFKADYLSRQIGAGNSWPTLVPWWYNGLELFRHWPPLPIYVLVGLQRLTGDIFVAGAWLVPLAAAVGGLSWLLYARRLGWLAALAAGLAWAVWPDNVWVGLFDGNLPRVIATALLPLAFLTFLDSLEMKHWPWSGLGFVILLQLIILSHAMVGAMVCVAFGAFCLLYWLSYGTNVLSVARGAALLGLGVLSSAWWLLPSLTGGITSISPEATRESLSQGGFFSPHDPRTFFIGIASVALIAAVVATWKRRRAVSKALAVCAVLGVLITIPWVVPLYLTLPLSHLMWPTRFTSLTALALLLSFLAWAPDEAPGRGVRLRQWVSAGAVLAVTLGNLLGTASLMHTGGQDPSLAALSRELAQRRPGWRVALFDESRLTSEASFALSDPGGREQVFGFAYQGAATGPGLVLMNTALEHRDYAYAIDRAWQSGATDLVAATSWISTRDFAGAAAAAGFGAPSKYGQLWLFSKPSPPQAFVSPYRIVAIGQLAGIASMLFPAVETGRPRLDTYSEAELARYDTVFLTGVQWESRQRAEDLIRAYVGGGGRVVVDLTRFPKGILNDRPSFLGVNGERVTIPEMPEMTRGEDTLRLQPLSKEFDPWVAMVPQGLDEVDISFSYYGQPAAVLGTKRLAGGDVTFVGMNLPYHAYLTRDPEALRLLAGLLGAEPGAVLSRTAMPLDSYRASAAGFSFSLTVPADAAGQPVILPFAATDSLRVRVDGAEVKASSVENLIAITPGPGLHAIRFEAGPPPLAGVSSFVSIVTGLLMVAYVATRQVRAPARRKEASSSHDQASTAF